MTEFFPPVRYVVTSDGCAVADGEVHSTLRFPLKYIPDKGRAGGGANILGSVRPSCGWVGSVGGSSSFPLEGCAAKNVGHWCIRHIMNLSFFLEYVLS